MLTPAEVRRASACSLWKDALFIRWRETASVSALFVIESGSFYPYILCAIDRNSGQEASLDEIIAGLRDNAGGQTSPFPVIAGPDKFYSCGIAPHLRALADPPAETAQEVRDFLRGAIGLRAYNLATMLSKFALMGDLDFLNHLQAGNSRARQQAAETFPLLGEMLMLDKKILHAVDEEERLTPVIAKRFGLSATEMRRFGQVNRLVVESMLPGRKGNRDHDPVLPWLNGQPWACFSRAIVIVRALRDDQMPRSPDELRECLSFFAAAQTMTSTTGISWRPVKRLLASSPAGTPWRNLESRVQKAALPDMRDYINAITQTLSVALSAYQLRIRRPDLPEISRAASALLEGRRTSGQDRMRIQEAIKAFESFQMDWRRASARNDAIKEILTRDASLKEILEMQERWHHREAMIRNQAFQSKEDLRWEPLCGTVALPGGLSAREIHSSKQMDRQGRLEKHCVGGYTSTVLNPQKNQLTLIFSIEEQGRILSTLEVLAYPARDRDGKRVVIFDRGQHKAARNADPCHRAQQAANDLLDYLNSMIPADLLKAYQRAILSNADSSRENLRRSLLRAGANFLNPDIPEILVDSIRDVLPARLRGITIEELREAPLIMAVERDPANKEDILRDPDSPNGIRITNLMTKVNINQVHRRPGDILPIQEGEQEDQGTWFLQILRAKGVQEIRAFMSGAGDSGGLDKMLFVGKDGKPVIYTAYMKDVGEISIINANLDTTNLKTKLIDWVIEWVCEKGLEYGDYCNNQGGSVAMTVHLLSDGKYEIEADFREGEEYEDDYEEEPEEDLEEDEEELPTP